MSSNAPSGAQLTSPLQQQREEESGGGGSARRLVEQMDESRTSSVLMSSSTLRNDEGEDIESLLLLFLASSRSREELERELSSICSSAIASAADGTSDTGMSVGIDFWSASTSVRPTPAAHSPAGSNAASPSSPPAAASPSSSVPAVVSVRAHVSTRAELEPLDAAWFATSKYPHLVFELSSRAPLLYTHVRSGMWLFLVFVLNVLQAIIGIAAPNWGYLAATQGAMYVLMSVFQLIHLGQAEWNILSRLFWCADVHFMLIVNFVEQAIAGYVSSTTVISTVLYGVTYSLMMLVVVTLDACPRVPRWIKWLFTFSTAIFLFEVVLFFYLVPSPNIYIEMLGFFSIHLATTMSTCAVLAGTLTAVLSKRYWAHDTAMLRAPYAYFPTSDFRTAFDEQFARDHPARAARAATAPQMAQSRRSPRSEPRSTAVAKVHHASTRRFSQQHLQVESDDDDDKRANPVTSSLPLTPSNRLGGGAYPTRAMVIVTLPSSVPEWMQLASVLRAILLFGDDEEMDVLGAMVDHQVPARRVRIRTVEIEAAEATARRATDVHMVLDHAVQAFLPKSRSGTVSDRTSLMSGSGGVPTRHFLQLRPRVGKALLRSRPLVWIEAHQRFVLHDYPRLLPILFSVNVVVVLALSFVEGASVIHAVSRFSLSLVLAVISLQIMRDHLWLLCRSIEFWFYFWQIAVVAFIDVYVTIWCQRPLIITAAYVVNGFFYAFCAASLDAFRASPKQKGGIMTLFVVYNLLCTVLQQIKTNQNYCGTQILLGTDTFIIHLNSWMISTLLSIAFCQAKYAYRLLVAKWEFSMITHAMVQATVDEEHVKSLLNSVLWADE